MLASLAFLTATPACAQQQPQKPNILVIMGDDIGYWNISAYNRGMMGYRTPNSFRQTARVEAEYNCHLLSTWRPPHRASRWSAAGRMLRECLRSSFLRMTTRANSSFQ
jgi:hypothetical protein